jgi:Family of unknown function (DUF6941)
VNVEWVIPCRYVEVHDNLGTIIGAGIDTYWVADVPTPIQVVLAIRLLAMPDELGEAGHTAVNRVRDPRGEILGEVSGEVVIGGEAARPDWLVGTMVPMVVGFEAAEEGTYTIDVAVDDAEKSLPIHVVIGAPPGAAPA